MSASIGRYHVLRQLGRGGEATVYLAEDPALDRRVALKVLDAASAEDAWRRRRFAREAELASRVEHPGVCPVYEVGTGAMPFIAMRWIEGMTVDELIRCEPEARHDSLSRDARLRLIEKVAATLHALHEAGIVHLDVKPANLIVGRAGDPVLIDFGLARDAEGEGAEAPPRAALGTPAYLAPEQIEPTHAVPDRRSDVHALGVTAYELVTGRRPFDAPTRARLFRQILAHDPVSRRDPELSGDLAVVLGAALAKRPADRYATAGELAEEIARVRTHRPIRVRPPGPALRLVRWSQRNPARAVSTFAAGAILLAATLVVVGGKREVGAALTEARRVADARARALEGYRRLADVQLLREALTGAAELYPARAALGDRFDAWLARHAPLVERLPVHRASLLQLRADAEAWSGPQRERDHAKAIAWLPLLAEELARRAADAEIVTTDGQLRQLEDRRRALEDETEARSTWTFGEDDARRWRHDVLTRLVDDLEAFVDPRTGIWTDVGRRRAVARDIAAVTVDRCASAWSDAITHASRPEPYGRLRLVPHVGLIPLGPDPNTQLLEFLHWESHGAEEVPTRGADGRLSVTDETGIILVLIPGERFLMGAQSSDPTAAHHDSLAHPAEAPVNEVTLDAHLIGKYEVTQGQWQRLAGENPSRFRAGSSLADGTVTRLHPVESVPWCAAAEVLRRFELELPTEAQWEHAARARTATQWCSGDDWTELEEWANLADSSFARIAAPTFAREADLDDGHALHAPVGNWRANRFGLHDVVGNVREWCLDGGAGYGQAARRGDGLRPVEEDVHGIRGGAFDTIPAKARSAHRTAADGVFQADDLGFRAAAPLRR